MKEVERNQGEGDGRAMAMWKYRDSWMEVKQKKISLYKLMIRRSLEKKREQRRKKSRKV